MARIVYVPELGRSFSFKDGASDQDVSTYLRSLQPVAQQQAAPEAPPPSDVGAWGSSGLNWLSRFQTAGGGIAEMLGQPEYAKYFYDKAQQNLAEAGKYQPEEQSIMGAKTWGGSASALGEAAIQSAPDLAGGLAASFGTGALAGLAGGPIGAGIGALVGGTTYAFGSSLGSNIQRQAEEQGTSLEAADESTAAAAAAVQAPLEALADRILLGKFLPEGTTMQLARRIVGDGIVKHAVKGAAGEGLTEAAQQAIELGQANPEKLFEFDSGVQKELLDSAIAGGFLGGIAGGVLEPAGNYYAGRGQRQLQRDLAAETQANFGDLSRAQVAKAADALQSSGIEGTVNVDYVETPEGFSRYTINKNGQPIVDTNSADEAAKAVALYKARTGVNIQIDEKAEPKIGAIQVGNRRFPTFEAATAERDRLRTEVASDEAFASDPFKVERAAKSRNVSTEVYKSALEKSLKKKRESLSMFDKFFSSEPIGSVTPEKSVEIKAAEAPVEAVQRTTEEEKLGKPAEIITPETPDTTETDAEAEGFDPITGEQLAPEPITSEEQIPEMPVGAVEMPVEEARVLPDAIVDEAKPVQEVPQPIRTEDRPVATSDDLSALQTELFGKPINVRDMTPEQKQQYELERDKRFPTEKVDVYYSAQPTGDKAPRNLREAAIVGARIPDTPENQKWMSDIYTGVMNRVKSIAPTEIEVNLKTMIDAPQGLLMRGEFIKGKDELKDIINLSIGILEPGMKVEDAVKKIVDTFNHEMIHALRAKGLIRPAEWRMLSRAASITNVPGKAYTYLDKAAAVYTPNGNPISEEYANPDSVAEEAVAEMYREWVKNKNSPKEIRGLFNRITEFFRRIFQVLRDKRYEKIFNEIEAGRVKDREVEAAPKAGGERLFSAAPAVNSDEFKKWFGNSVAVNPDGTPARFYHGTPFSFKEFGKGRSASIDGEEGPFFFSKSPKFADQYATSAFYAGGGGKDIRSGGKIIPVYLSVQKPFDYENLSHIKMVAKEVARGVKSGELAPIDVLGKKDFKVIEEAAKRGTINSIDEMVADEVESVERDLYAGHWSIVERPAIQKAIRNLGFDGFYLNESGFKNLAVYRPEQVKSIFNKFEEGAAESRKFSAAPLPPYVQRQNSTLFAPIPNVSFKDMMFNYVFGHRQTGKTLQTMNGPVTLSAKTMAAIRAKTATVDNVEYVKQLESILNKQTTGNFQRMAADYSATAALAWNRRASHIFASMMLRGKLTINFADPGNIQSATMKVEDDPDSLKEVFNILLEPGPLNPTTGKPDNKLDIFRSYAVAKRGEWLAATGQAIPSEITPQYIRDTVSFTQREYPEVIEAYNKYQRYNKNLLTAAKDAGVISQAELGRLTNQMNYYGFIYEVYGEPLGPTSPQKTASKFKLRAYTGSGHGNLVNDPMFVILQNSQFWVSSIAKNLAATKAFNVAQQMGEARLLGATEDPNEAAGEMKDVMYFSQNGAVKRFAVKDPLLVTALGSDDRIDLGRLQSLISFPTHVLRESVTRDPGFILRNLLRDTLSSWITSGTDFTPIIGTLKGMKTALKDGASFKELGSHGVVGSYDLAMLGPAELAAKLKKNAMPINIHTVGSVEGATALLGSLWNRMGHISEASDAATRIAVYDACRKQGMSEAEAAMQAIELLDFTRHGASNMLGVLTKIIPFLNARIQGMDVLWQAGRAGVRYATGRSLGERDANIGKKIIVRGAMLAAISMALELINSDDDDYQQLDDYIKNGNLLIPLKYFGLEGQFAAIPKPFEAGLLFSTFPQQIVKAGLGQASMRENIALFTSQIGSTLGVNPIPQVILPAIEVITNHDFYTGLPLISEGKARMAPELQYNTSTSQLAMMIGGIPMWYNTTTGRFEGLSPIVVDNLISGYGGPIGSYLAQAVSLVMEDANVGPERMPAELSKLPVVKSFFVDAKNKNPKVVTQAYELFRIADEANRSFSRLRQTGDAEAIADYLDQNRDILSYKKYIFKLADRLNKLSAEERRIEADKEMTREEKLAAQKNLREVRIRLASKVGEINAALGR